MKELVIWVVELSFCYLVKPATYSLTDAFNSIRHLTSISLKLGKDYSWQHVFSEYKKLIDKYEINKFGRN